MDKIIKQTEDMAEIRAVFPHAWAEDIEKEMSQNKCTVYIVENSGGCLIKKFDGMNTLFYLWVHESLRNQGIAQAIVKEVGEKNKPLPTFARFREDEENIKTLFLKSGYEVVHKGVDKFWIVAYRNL